MFGEIIGAISNFMYSYLLIIMLIGVGLYYTLRTRLVQVRMFKETIRVILEKPVESGAVSSFQALMVSTASRVGTGNIIGISTAICLGGYGAVFWMWVIAVVGGASEFNFFEEEKRAGLFDGLYPSTDGDSIIEVLNTKRPNILIILMESYGGTFIEPLGGIPDVAPHFNRLTEEGVFFTNCYANSFRTDRGTVCTFSGYLGLPTASVMKIPAKSRTLPSIAEELVKAGYKTDFLYGGDINFTNMKSYLLSKGYQRLTADKDFSLAEQTSNAWGVNDDITFEYLYNQLKDRKETPWHTAFLTLSSHEPFEVPYHRLDEQIPNAFAFTDDCLGKFIEKLKQTPVWKDLLVICLPDHGFYYPREGLNTSPRFYHIPMLWLGGAVKQPVKIDKIMNQADLAATLLGQLGLDHSSFNFSRNVLGSDYTYPFAFYSFNNGFAFRDSTGVTVVDNNSGNILLEEPAGTNTRIDKGKAILQSVYDDLGRR